MDGTGAGALIWRAMTTVLAMVLTAAPLSGVPLPIDAQQELVDKAQVVELKADTSALTEGERKAVGKLLEAGKIFQELYERQLHPAAVKVRGKIAAQGGPTARLYRIFHGPIATTLDNQRRPVVTVEPEALGRNVYPFQSTREEVTAFVEQNPSERESIFDLRTVVRRADRASLSADLAALKRHPALVALHPGLREKLIALSKKPSPRVLYAAPYAVAFADELTRAYGLIREAADAVEGDDPPFAAYLRNRARDLLSNDYESGDASWVTGEFKHLNAQIGAYETYDDELYGQKTFFSFSVLVRDEAATAKLDKALGGLQALEDALPYEPHKTVRTGIPVGVYAVLADFGQARTANTASILPNDERHTRKYGRTVLIRGNVLRHPDLHQNSRRGWEAVIAPAHHRDLGAEGGFNRTVWHEIGHYLGPDRDLKGRPVTASLEDTYSAMEEMKADLISLYSAPALRASGVYDDAALKNLYASGIHRSLNPVRPRRQQPYQTMRLIQFNWFLDQKLLEPTQEGLKIHYERYHEVVAGLLKQVLALQRGGDRNAADAFITKWTRWDEGLHERLAKAMRAQQKYQFSEMRYPALGD